jgi:hypothetical protein
VHLHAVVCAHAACAIVCVTVPDLVTSSHIATGCIINARLLLSMSLSRLLLSLPPWRCPDNADFCLSNAAPYLQRVCSECMVVQSVNRRRT